MNHHNNPSHPQVEFARELRAVIGTTVEPGSSAL